MKNWLGDVPAAAMKKADLPARIWVGENGARLAGRLWGSQASVVILGSPPNDDERLISSPEEWKAARLGRVSELLPSDDGVPPRMVAGDAFEMPASAACVSGFAQKIPPKVPSYAMTAAFLQAGVAVGTDGKRLHRYQWAEPTGSSFILVPAVVLAFVAKQAPIRVESLGVDGWRISAGDVTVEGLNVHGFFPPWEEIMPKCLTVQLPVGDLLAGLGKVSEGDLALLETADGIFRMRTENLEQRWKGPYLPLGASGDVALPPRTYNARFLRAALRATKPEFLEWGATHPCVTMRNGPHTHLLMPAAP